MHGGVQRASTFSSAMAIPLAISFWLVTRPEERRVAQRTLSKRGAAPNRRAEGWRRQGDGDLRKDFTCDLRCPGFSSADVVKHGGETMSR